MNLSLIRQVEPEDLKILNDERLRIRERVKNRYADDFYHQINQKDHDKDIAIEALSLRNDALTHVVTTLEKMQEKHPDFKDAFDETPLLNRPRRNGR